MRVLRRDLYTCQAQGCGARSANHVDHIIPRFEGGTDEDANLQTLCSRCHQRKSAREGNAAKRRGAA